MNNLDSDPGAIIPQLLLIVLLTTINAFFASAEMAIVSINKSKVRKLKEEGNIKAKLIEELIEEPSNFLSTIQIGITLAGFFSSASAATGISEHISKLLSPFNIPYSNEISMICVTLILSYFTLVFGELVPKRIALKKAEKISLISVKPIYFISKIAKPFIKLLSLSTTLILKITRNNETDIEEKISEEEIKSLISQSQEDGCIERDEEEMIYSVFNFNDKTAKEIMTPRNELFAINIEDDINIILDNVLSSSYSRIPVYKDNIDNIIGILYIKDLLIEAKRVGFDNIQLKNILQKPFFTLETRRTNELFKVLKDRKVHLAILFDEYGGTVGIVTMEDLIEEIVGDIEDEYDSEECLVTKIDENNFFVKASMTVNDFNDLFNINIEIGDYDTLNGYLLTKLNKIPDEGSSFKFNDIDFTIVKVKNRRIESIKITLNYK